MSYLLKVSVNKLLKKVLKGKQTIAVPSEQEQKEVIRNLKTILQQQKDIN